MTATQPIDAVTAEVDAMAAAHAASPPPSRWQRWRQRRRARAAAMDAGYRLSPQAYRRP